MNSTEQKIFSAFRKAAEYCSTGGFEPTDALVKSAMDADLNPEMTRRAGEMLNIFLTHRFMKSASDKTASFPTADLGDVLRKAFTEDAPASSEARQGYRSSKKASAAGEPKLSFIGSAATPEPALRDITDLVEQLRGHVKVASESADEARRNAEYERHAAFATYKSLIGSLRESHNYQKFAAFEAQCLSEYGEEALGHLDGIADQLPGVKRLSRDEYPKRAFYFARGPLNDLFDSFVEGISKVAAADSDFESSLASARAFELEAENIYRKVAGAEPKEGNPLATAGDLLSKTVGSGLTSMSGGLAGSAARYLPPELGGTGPASGAADKAVGDQYGRAMADSLERQYKGPQQQVDMEMQNVQRSAILKDLLSNDEIISSLDPQLVQGAYNGLLQMAPDLTLNRAVVAGYLRTAGSQQALDPFTAQQLGNVNKVQLENKNLKDGKPASK